MQGGRGGRARWLAYFAEAIRPGVDLWPLHTHAHIHIHMLHTHHMHAHSQAHIHIPHTHYTHPTYTTHTPHALTLTSMHTYAL